MGEARRVWSAALGAGTLTQEGYTVRVQLDDGRRYELAIDGQHVGTPAAYAASEKRPQHVDWGTPHGNVEWLQWDTYVGENGDVLVVRRGGPPPEGTPKPEDTVHVAWGAGMRAPHSTRPRKSLLIAAGNKAMRDLLLATLNEKGWNLSQTAAALGMAGATNVTRAIQHLGLGTEYESARERGDVYVGGRPRHQRRKR